MFTTTSNASNTIMMLISRGNFIAMLYLISKCGLSHCILEVVSFVFVAPQQVYGTKFIKHDYTEQLEKYNGIKIL